MYQGPPSDPPDFSAMRQEIYSHMLRTRPQKFKWFLRALRSFKYLSAEPKRGEFLESYYTLMRFIDDVVDGDAPLPAQYRSSEEYVLDKIRFARDPVNPSDGIDQLINHCLQTGAEIGYDFTAETDDILNSMLFDARRHGKLKVFPEDVLHHHFHLLDVRGTIRGAIKVFGGDPDNYPLLQPLGLASRIYYNLRDYEEDMRAGLVNISVEDHERFRITPSDLESRTSPPIRDWMRSQATQGMALIDQHRANVKRLNPGILLRITFPLVYERPAKKYFEAVLNGRI